MTTEQTLILILAVAGFVVANFVRARYRHEFIVTEGFAGLLYHDGKLVETLVAGHHVRWGKNFRVALVDTRKTLLQVAGQEVLSSDNVGVKLSVVLTTQIHLRVSPGRVRATRKTLRSSESMFRTRRRRARISRASPARSVA